MHGVTPVGNRGRRSIGFLVAAVLFGLLPSVGSAETPPSGSVSDEPISIDELVGGTLADGLSDNGRYAPSEHARRAQGAFVGTIELAGAPMMVVSDAPGGGISNPVLGKDTELFPDVDLSFVTVGDELVPTTQDVILNGSLADTASYWDIIVQPGRVWREPGDGRWNRAAFPFALVNAIEGETHNGVAMFAYQGGRITPVRFQVVQMTSPFYVPEYFSAWGTTDGTLRRGKMQRVGHVVADHLRDMAGKIPVRPWSELEALVDPATLEEFLDHADVVQGAVLHDGVLYRSECETSAGPFPYCDEIRYGVWSMTKSAMMNAAMMRMAETYGSEFLDEPIATYLPEASIPGWESVTFDDLAHMASGHGPDGDPLCYLCDYDRWYVALSEAEKTAEALDYPGPFADPGTVFNYRDQDAYLLGMALDSKVRHEDGAHASVWNLLRREVYRPLGIRHAPTNATVEPDGTLGQPLMAYGYYPTLDDLAKLALLYLNEGRWHGRQILDPDLVGDIAPAATAPSGALDASGDGSVHYHLNWWFQSLDLSEGCPMVVPQMSGWGGNTLTLLPDDTALLRIRNSWEEFSDPQESIDALADAFTESCPD